MMNQTSPTAFQLPSTSQPKPIVQQQEQITMEVSNFWAGWRELYPNYELIDGTREAYLDIGVSLYEASIRCDWKAAQAILMKKPELVRYCITENGETALHVASSVKTRSKKGERFVKNLVDMMEKEDLELRNENHNTAFYLAAVAGNIEIIKIMMERNRGLLTIPGARGRMMPLYAAALFAKHDVVKYLYEYSNELSDDDGWNTQIRGWLLEKCVDGDMFDVALKIVKKYPDLGSQNSILLSLARKPDAISQTKSNIIKRSINSVFALTGLTMRAYKLEEEGEALQLLKIIWKDTCSKPKKEIDDILRGPPDSENLIHASPLQELISEHLSKLDVEIENITGGPPDVKLNKAHELWELFSKHLEDIDVETKNLVKQDRLSFRKGDPTLELQKLISNHVVNIHSKLRNIIRQESGGEEDQASSLHKLIVEHISKTRSLSGLDKKQYSYRILFNAAEMGNSKFLLELIRRYPDLIWKVNDDNQSMFHIAVKYRHEGIYNLLYEIGSMKDLITPLKDTHGNNMLHLVGKGTTKERLADVSGAALQMQRELLWFQEVDNMIPPSYRERKNKDGLYPRELFSQEHKELIREGEKWMKDTASQCMVVAALIATIVFAAAFTIPGGYNQNDGIPIFYRKKMFVAFVVADAMSLFLSSTSILTFLSILTSRYAERDFVKSLPTKLMLGLATLFLSITTMMITFSVSFFILYHKEMNWIPVLIGAFALMPVILYIVLQYHVLADVIRSTYGSKYLFKPTKQVLYYANPRV